MNTKPIEWKKGKGKLGVLSPLIGTWTAMADSPMGKIKCTRAFAPILGGKYIQLTALWEIPKYNYEELAVYGVFNGKTGFKSFTSDGKSSEGYLVKPDAENKNAIIFEAEMPAGLARFLYYPGLEGEIVWAVEAKNKKGWKRFVEHHYRKIKESK